MLFLKQPTPDLSHVELEDNSSMLTYLDSYISLRLFCYPTLFDSIEMEEGEREEDHHSCIQVQGLLPCHRELHLDQL